MYEKYSGLPDTTKPSSENTDRVARSSGNTGRYDTRSSGYNSSPSGRKPSSSKRKKMLQRRRMVVAVSSLILLGLLVLAVVVIARSCATPVEIDPATDAFRSGVYINGANVSGKTIEEVKATLESNEQYAINNIAITLQGDGFSKTITGMDMAATTNLNEVLTAALSGGSNQVYYTEISLDKDALSQRIDEINQTLTAPPTDASFTVEVSESGKPTFTYLDGKAGFGIDVAATEELVHQAFVNKQFQTSITPPLTTVDPLITVADVKAHTTLVGSFTTTYDFKGTAENTEEQRLELIPNRAYNVEKCAGLINNQVVKPGHSWSFNDTVGDRNEKNGWKEANGIFGGDTFSRQYGGGVCQVSTTLYNALLKCYPYVKLNRQKHSIPSTYVDKGLDATVDTGHIDFSFKNTSEYPLYVFAYISKNKQASGRKRNITVNIYGEALPEGITYEPHTELMEEILPGEPEITESKKLFIGEEQILAEARSGFVVDVYIDRYLNGALQESIFLYKDTYDGNPLRKRVGIIATPTPIPSATPAPTPIPNGGQDLP